mmetsp:Transcript_22634/g.56991  ORF Transcript_22634/g.56991 Transcript_22634/m.56991 type:complete len:615 (+) Transcript_22634:374-2218(+)|eukprot:jgi/Tetstr1/441246/TSEL_029498.t1
MAPKEGGAPSTSAGSGSKARQGGRHQPRDLSIALASGSSAGSRDYSCLPPPLAMHIKTPPVRRSPRSPRGSDVEQSYWSRSGSSSPRLSTSDIDTQSNPQLLEEMFTVQRVKYRAMLDNQGLNLTLAKPGALCCVPSSLFHTQHFLYQEILQAGIADEHHGTCWPVSQDFAYKKLSFLVIHTFSRSHKNPNEWKPLELILEHAAEEVVMEWAKGINERIKALSTGCRPRRVQVYVNPFGGHRRAEQVWSKTCVPIFESASVKFQATVTSAAGHAQEEVQAMTLEEMQALDGLVVVGGDGLFGEVLNALLTVRSKGGPRGAAAARLRLGHIPAGSTDALAWSVNGTRNPASAALHIALGDRSPLDVLRVDPDGAAAPTYSCCLAGCGFFGDVQHSSEQMRWAGPARYDIAGFWTFLKHGSHSVRVQYLPAEVNNKDSRRADTFPVRQCSADCSTCRMGYGLHSSESLGSLEAGTMPAWSRHSGDLLAEHADKVVTVEGRYKGVMCVVTPCRSDKSVHGVMPMAHLADGKVWLILIKACNHLQYLRFLIMLSTTGVIPGKLSFVETIECCAVRVEPDTNDCKWNVDGEPLPHRSMSCQVHRGLVEVFGRGVEQPCR